MRKKLNALFAAPADFDAFFSGKISYETNVYGIPTCGTRHFKCRAVADSGKDVPNLEGAALSLTAIHKRDELTVWRFFKEALKAASGGSNKARF
jgi:hypothetical protein